VEADLDILPLMNLFVVLIPMLLISAVFVQLAVVDMHLPPADSAADAPERDRIDLAVTIQADRYVVESRHTRKQVISRDDVERADEELATALAQIARRYPDNEEIMIVSQGDTPYQELIHLMDISRDTGMSAVSLLGATAN
jgi:biopolymer transport protein ExbD